MAQTVKKLPALWKTWVRSLGGEDPLEKWVAVFFPEEFHGQRSLASYRPWGCKESDTTEQLTHTHTRFLSKTSICGNNQISKSYYFIYLF